MDAIRDHSDAVEVSRDTGKPIPNLSDLLAKLKAARCAYFDNYLEVERRANEEWYKKFVPTAGPRHLELNNVKSDSIV